MEIYNSNVSKWPFLAPDFSNQISIFGGCVNPIEKFFDQEGAKITKLTYFIDNSHKSSDRIPQIASKSEFKYI